MSRFVILTSLLVLCLHACQTDEDRDVARPNILFAIGDDISFPHMGAYGTSWIETPNFDKVASNGLLFMNAYTPNAKCAPSRSIILTGRNSWQLEEAANHYPNFPEKFTSVFEALKDHGYHTGSTAKGWGPGDPGEIDGIKRELTGKKYNDITLTPPTTGIGAIDYAANFKTFLEDNENGKPFLFWYGAYEPHRAFEYGTGVSKGNKRLDQIEEVFRFWPDIDSVKHDLLDYAYEIEWFDQHLGRMMDHLERTGELDNTIIIVTADNGMAFPRVKGQVYELSNHMPLAIMWGKGITNPGRVIEEYISFADFAPTFLDVANVDISSTTMQPMEGRSMVPFFDNLKNAAARDYIIVGKERHDIGRPDDQGYPVRGIIKGDFLYLQNFKPERWPSGNPITGYLNTDGSPTKTSILQERRYDDNYEHWNLNFGKRPSVELYNINYDPECIHNLASSESHKGTKESLAALLEEELAKQGDPRIMGNGDIFDNYIYSGERHRDFYNRFIRGEIDNTQTGWVQPGDYEKESLE